MRRILSVALACVSIMGCLSINTAAASSTVYFDTEDVASTWASGSFNMSVSAKGKTAADQTFPLSAGETVRIRATYDPEDASMDFGLIDPDGVFHFINVTTGSIDETIEVPESGNYRLAIRNNSETEVKVAGFVRY